MELDLSALMGGSSGHCGGNLNDEFSVSMPTGENVFTKAFGDRTTFKTPNGSVTVSMVFNPTQRWTGTAILASATTDYMNEIREKMCDMLLKNKDLAPRQASLKEKQWRTILQTLPNETLSKHVFSDKAKLNEYINILNQTNEAQNKEDKLLTEALKIQDYNFSFEIALDAFPTPDRNKHAREKSVITLKTGTVTFYFEGVTNKETKKIPGDLDKMMTDNISPMKTQVKQSQSCPSSPSNEVRALVKRKIVTNKERTEKEELNKLRESLGLNKPEWTNAKTVVEKKFPLSASLFFDAVSAWFTCTLHTRSRNLQDKKDRNHIYQ